MQIKEEITVTLTPEDIKEAIKIVLKEKGYKVNNIHFDVGEKCEGFYGQETYYKVLNGATCKVERILKANKKTCKEGG
jgi:hypothetical protein